MVGRHSSSLAGCVWNATQCRSVMKRSTSSPTRPTGTRSSCGDTCRIIGHDGDRDMQDANMDKGLARNSAFRDAQMSSPITSSLGIGNAGRLDPVCKSRLSKLTSQCHYRPHDMVPAAHGLGLSEGQVQRVLERKREDNAVSKSRSPPSMKAHDGPAIFCSALSKKYRLKLWDEVERLILQG